VFDDGEYRVSAAALSDLQEHHGLSLIDVVEDLFRSHVGGG
jgi:hypothetical protein